METGSCLLWLAEVATESVTCYQRVLNGTTPKSPQRSGPPLATLPTPTSYVILTEPCLRHTHTPHPLHFILILIMQTQHYFVLVSVENEAQRS